MDGQKIKPIECHYDTNFRLSNKGEISTVAINKMAKPIHNKGVITKEGRLVPFGWSPYDKPVNWVYYENHQPPNNLARILHSHYEDEEE